VRRRVGRHFQPEIKITSEDPFDIFPDPYSRRYDWNEDAKFVCRVKLPTLDEAKELYPRRKELEISAKGPGCSPLLTIGMLVNSSEDLDQISRDYVGHIDTVDFPNPPLHVW
jgi:hypothetical protein